jgi:hypothetical protein
MYITQHDMNFPLDDLSLYGYIGNFMSSIIFIIFYHHTSSELSSSIQ